MKTILVIVLIFMGGIQSFGQGIEFFKGDYNAALEKAKQEGKMLFVDFYADWCGPCKRLAKDVFTLEAVGKYFNEQFVSIQIDAENPANRQVVKQNKVRSYPTLAFFDADGKLLSRLEGALDGAALIKSAKVVTGEKMSFEEIYTKFKSSKNDLVLMQQLLLGAPAYVSTLENMEQTKWIARIEKIFKDYIDLKMGPELINADDYRIINTFHHADKPGDKLMEFMNKNMEAYLKLGEGPAYFVMEYNNKIMENAVLRRFLSKRPINNLPEQPGERDVAICIPYSKSKSPETYNFLNGHAKQALTESINDLFRINMWSDLGDLNDMSCKKMSAFRSWCEQQGIDIEYAETIRMKWYRMRKAYQEKGINLFNLKRCKKDDFS